MNAATDAQLVAAIVAGHRDAFAALYDRYADALYDVAMSMLRDPHEAADAVQDVFVIAAERLHQLREPDRVRSWLFSVLRHDVYRRSAKRRRVAPTATVAEQAAPVMAEDAGGRLEYEDLARLVRDASEGLDDRDRLVLELSVRQGLQGSDLASALGVSPEQSYSLVYRMRERTERALGALVVARTNRDACRDLDQLLRDWDGRFSVLVRKRVARHVDQCVTCESQRTRVGVLAAFAAAPVWVAPLALRDRVLTAFPGTPSVAEAGSSGESAGSADGAGTPPGDPAAVASEVMPQLVPVGRVTAAELSWAPDGFPGAARVARRGVVLLVAGIVAIFTLGIFGARALRDDEPATLVAGATEVRDTTTSLAPGLPPATTSGSSTSTTGDATPSTGVPGTVAPTTAVVPVGPPPTTVLGTVAPTTAPTAPTAPSTTGSAPTTTATAPTTTSAPATTSTAPAASPRLFVTPGRVDVGASGSSTTFTVRNDGSGPLTWSAAATAGPLRAEPASGTLAPGTSGSVTVTVDRANHAEGAFTGAVTFGGNGGSANVAVAGRVERGPIVTLSTNPSPLVGLFTPATGCAPATATITATVTDETGIGSVTLHWRGPGGAPGSSITMPMRADRYVATFGPFATIGSLEWWVRATDTRGNVTTTPTRSAPVTATCIR